MRYPNIFDTKTPQGRNCCYWNRELWDTALSFRKWGGSLFEGVTPFCDNDYFNFILLTRGFGVFAKIDEKIYACECGYRGHQYTYLPRIINVTNPYIKKENNGKMIQVEVGKDAIFVKSNKSMTPISNTITHYAEIMGTIATSMGINLINSRSTTIYRVSDSDKANKVRLMIDQIQAGNLAVINDDNFMEDIIDSRTGRLPTISTPNEYLLDKYISAIDNVFNQFLAEIGIDSSGANMIKAERNTNEEVHSNDQKIEVKRSFWIDPLKFACDQVNDLFGEAINVEYVRPERGVTNGQIVEDGEGFEGNN